MEERRGFLIAGEKSALTNLPLLKSGLALLVIIAIWFLGAELLVRSPLGGNLPPSSVGADSFEFDIKVFYLERSIRERGPLDCLIVGDSMANDGPDPLLMEKAYQARTGYAIHCFNFGMPALTLDSSGPLAEALVHRFRPKLLIFILSGRDFDPTHGVVFRHVSITEWTQYNLGVPSLRGWAVNSLQGYRYFLFLKYWLNPSNRINYINSWRNISPDGFTPLYGFGPPREFSTSQSSFSMDVPSTQQGFNRLLQLKQNGIPIVFIDAPIQPESYLLQHDHFFLPYLESMDEIFAPLDIPFWRTEDLSASIPTDAWYDFQHVNEKGVPIFSEWAGEQLSQQYPPEFFK